MFVICVRLRTKRIDVNHHFDRNSQFMQTDIFYFFVAKSFFLLEWFASHWIWPVIDYMPVLLLAMKNI